jgi:hypothetical protein
VIELDDAVRDHERVVIREAHHTGAELDPPRVHRCGGDEQLRRGDALEAAGVMLADPRLVVTEPVEMSDELQVSMQGFRRVVVQGMKRGEEDAGAQFERTHWEVG